MPRSLSLGFIGGGMNSAVGRCHKVASQMDDRWRLTAGAFSRSSDVNRETGAQWGVREDRVYDDWRSLLASESGRLDAVVVLTPTPQHSGQIRELLAAGFDVISEKALASSSQEAEELDSQSRRAGRFLAITMNYSGYPMIRELRRMIRAGFLGEVVGVHIEMPQEGYLRQDSSGLQLLPQDWRQSDGIVPTVSLDLGTHTHHLLRFLTDEEPVQVIGTESHHGRVTDVADYVSCLAEMPSGADVNMWFGKCVLGSRNGLRVKVFGDSASAQWVQGSPEELVLAYPNGSVTCLDRASPGIDEAAKHRYQRFKAGHPAGFLEAFANLYWDLADDLLAQRDGAAQSDLTFGASHAAAGLRMLETIGRSSRNRRWAVIPAEGGVTRGD